VNVHVLSHTYFNNPLLFLRRYGDPKLCSDRNDIAFAQRFHKECSLTFLEASLAQLATLSQVGGLVR
jgi:hypothetical protein